SASSPFLGPDLEALALGNLRSALKHPPDQTPLSRPRILSTFPPPARLAGPAHRTEARDKSITASTVRVRAANIFGNLRGLSVPKHTDADRLDVEMSAGNSVEGVGLGARPAAQIEPPRNTLLLAVEMFEQRDKLVALDQEPGRV